MKKLPPLPPTLQSVEYILLVLAPLALLISKATLLVLLQLFIHAASSAVQGVSPKPVPTCCRQVYLTCYLKYVNPGVSYFPFHAQVSLKRKPSSSVHIRAKYVMWVMCGDKVLGQKRKEPVWQQGCTILSQSSLHYQKTSRMILKMGGIWRYRFLLSVKLKPSPRSLEEFMAQVPGMGIKCHGLYSWTIYCDSLQWFIGAWGGKKEELPPFPAPFLSISSPELCWTVSGFLIRKWHIKDITGTISRHCKEFPSTYMEGTSPFWLMPPSNLKPPVSTAQWESIWVYVSSLVTGKLRHRWGWHDCLPVSHQQNQECNLCSPRWWTLWNDASWGRLLLVISSRH